MASAGDADVRSETAAPARPRRVLMIVQNLPVPFDRRVWMEARTLHAAGYEVSVISPRGKFATAPYEHLEGIHVYRHPLPIEAAGKLGYLAEYGSAVFWELLYSLRVLHRHGFDVIHACNPPDLIFLVAMPFKKLLGKKFIFDHHDLCPELYDAKFDTRGRMYKLLLALERRTFKLADLSIATNASYRRVAIERCGMAPDRVHTVRSGPDLGRVQPRAPDAKWRNGRAHLVAYLGVIGDQEGLDLLVGVVERLVRVQGRHDVQFVVMGSGPKWPAIKALVEEKGLADYITLTGRVDDETVFTVLSTADVCVNPDRPNAMNDMSTMNKVMEYMAIGKPLVQFDLTEGRVSAGEASLYARKSDLDDFAAKLLQLIDDPELRRRMGAYGLERLRNELSWDKEAPKLLAAYEALFAGDRRETHSVVTGPVVAGARAPLETAPPPGWRDYMRAAFDHKAMEQLGRNARDRLPQRLVLHADYFRVRRLCAQWAAGEHDAYQPELRKRLRHVLTTAVAHVPFYRRGRITLEQCSNEDPFDLVREFPFLTKDQIIAEPDAFVSARVPKFLRYQKATSGSSGKGIVVWRTKRTADIEKAFLDQQWAPWGWSAEKSRILRIGDEARRKRDEYPVFIEHNRLMVSTLHLTDIWLPEIYEQAVAYRPDFIHAYASCAIALARFIVDSGRPPLRVRGLMLTSEPLPAKWIRVLQKAFEADIAVNYGLTERTNFAEATVAHGGPPRLDYRINPIYGFQENFAHPDGRLEIVGTSYWNDVMPLIRYRTGDFGRIAGGRLEQMDGREIEFLVTRQGKTLPGLSLEPEMEVWDKVKHLQLYQARPGKLEFRIVPKTGSTPEQINDVVATLDPLWSDYFDITVKIVDDIPRLPSGKTRMVVRERQPADELEAAQ